MSEKKKKKKKHGDEPLRKAGCARPSDSIFNHSRFNVSSAQTSVWSRAREAWHFRMEKFSWPPFFVEWRKRKPRITERRHCVDSSPLGYPRATYEKYIDIPTGAANFFTRVTQHFLNKSTKQFPRVPFYRQNENASFPLPSLPLPPITNRVEVARREHLITTRYIELLHQPNNFIRSFPRFE